MDVKGYHGLCCEMAESTIGHNRTRDCLADCFAQADPGTDTEVPGLCPRAPTLRPADILSKAAHPTQIVAVDVGIRAPHASTAGDEPLESMRSDKIIKYAPHLEDLRVQGIIFQPAIFSAYGRRHPSATQMIKLSVAKAIRRRGNVGGERLLRWWLRQISAEIWRRAAKMILACLPRRTFTTLAEEDMPDD